jgi:hypothetical protein
MRAAQDRNLDRAAWRRDRGLAGPPVDPFFNVNTPKTPLPPIVSRRNMPMFET